MVPVFPLLLVTILLCPLSPEAQEYYVTPTPLPNPDCPLNQPCHTLNYYASDVSSLFNNRENVSLLFLDGDHELKYMTRYQLSSPPIQQVQSLTIASVNGLFDNGIPRASIQFNSILLQLKNVSVLEIKNIQLLRANLNIENVEWFISQNAVYKDSAVSILSAIAKGVHITGLQYVRSSLALNFSGNHSITVNIANTVCLDSNPYYYVCFFLITSTDVHVLITNSIFQNNKVGLYLYETVAVKKVQLKLEVIDSQFINNQLACYSQHSGNHSVSFRNVSVIDGLGGTTTGGNVAIIGPATVTMENCLFDHNNAGSAIRLLHVKLYFIGNTTFSNNIGNSGGAIMMVNTTMWLNNGAHISFINNSVSEVGGAIWVTEYAPIPPFYSSTTPYPQCFYQLTFDLAEPLDNQTLPVSVTFSDNKAQRGGYDIYGAALQSNCKMTPNRQISSYMVQNKIFLFDNRTLFSITSSPKRVCLCENGEPVCVTDMNLNTTSYNLYGAQTELNYDYETSATPGEKFNLSVALVGNDFGLVTGGVYALDTSGEDVSFFISPGQNLQQITDLRCTDIEYSVHPVSENTATANLTLSTDSFSASVQLVVFQTPFSSDYPDSIRKYFNGKEITAQLLNAPVFVRITILRCPLGQSLTDETFEKCECQPELKEFAESCAIINNTGVLYRNGKNWIGTHLFNNTTTIIAYKNCPFGYCKSEPLGVNLDNPDIQCALNHSGILCGGCPPGLSLAIGSSRCIHCPDNNRVALLMVFIVAGVALVLFIKLLDITVAHGTINGLILYANIIWINQGIFFPVLSEQTHQNVSNLYYFLRVFVAWLNLDFGIETCFIKGLDAYGKTWLQFVFPTYLCLIALLIVLLCHYSTRATKIFGYNAVAVLTTLLFLSYTKLQRTIVLSLQYSNLSHFNPNDTYIAWTLDGNVKYFGSFHDGLFGTAIAVSIFLCIPFILILLFAGHLHRLPCASISRRVIKSRPLLDTFTGPLKAKHQYWVGLTFFIRGVLVILAAIFETANPTVNIDLVVLLSALLFPVVVKVYKKKYLCLLELAFLINLVILGVAFLSTDVLESRVMCTCTSVAISFLIFLGIVVYHLYLIVRKCYKARKVQEPENTLQQQPAKTVTTYDVDIGNFHTTSWIGLREDLLESK